MIIRERNDLPCVVSLTKGEFMKRYEIKKKVVRELKYLRQLSQCLIGKHDWLIIDNVGEGEEKICRCCHKSSIVDYEQGY